MSTKNTALHLSRFWFVSALTFLTPKSFGQSSFEIELQNMLYLEEIPTEKVHLHVDRSIYSPGEDIWFKAYLLEGTFHSPANTSHNLHVEIIAPNGDIKDTLTILIQGGLGLGDFLLDKNKYKEGTYQIRAYTNFMRNFGEDLFFKKKILIKEFIADQKPPIKFLDDKLYLDFFPEGGELTFGVNNKIAFKATDRSEKGVNLIFSVFEADSTVVKSISTSHKGMGFFEFTPQKGKNYHAIIEPREFTGKRYELPTPKSGYALKVGDQFKKVFSFEVNTQAGNVKGQRLKFTIQTRGKLILAEDIVINKTSNLVRINKSELPGGISCLTLYNENGSPVNERLFFNQLFEQVNIAISANKKSYGPKEKVELEITTTKAPEITAPAWTPYDNAEPGLNYCRSARAVLIAIYRKKGADRWGSPTRVGIKHKKAKGYYRVREFFSPDYDKPQEGFTAEDMRNTLFWEPLILTGEDGTATVTFFNGDKATDYNIRVEGVGLAGGLGETNSLYKVVKKLYLA